MKEYNQSIPMDRWRTDMIEYLTDITHAIKEKPLEKQDTAKLQPLIIELADLLDVL